MNRRGENCLLTINDPKYVVKAARRKIRRLCYYNIYDFEQRVLESLGLTMLFIFFFVGKQLFG